MHYSFHSTPTCTFKSRTQTTTKANQLSSIPGPADYNVKRPLHKTGTVAQTTETRNLYKKFQPNPGPGSYQAPSYITDGIKRSMSARFIDYTKHSPGPQDYDVKANQVLNKAPIQTLGYKSKSSSQIIFDHNTFKPGPTQYENKTQFVTKHGTFIGSAQRQDLTQTQKTPAPNYYMSESAADFASVANPRCRIGSQFRKTDFQRGEVTPGPAVYEKKTFVEQNQSKRKGFSCRQRVNDLIAQELSKMPAPGMYESHLKNKTTAPRCTTTQTKRKTFMDDMQKSTVQLPGPGTHDPAFKGTKYRSSSANIFTKSSRKPLDQNQKTPGPAQYTKQKKNVLNSAPQYSSTKTVAKNQFLAVNPENPGPGHYNAKISLVKPGLAISEVPKQKRPDFEKHRHMPGPGFYNLRGKEEGPTWKFPSEKRIAFTDLKSQSKNGRHYELTSKVVDPPSYMNVNSKIKFSPANTGISRA